MSSRSAGTIRSMTFGIVAILIDVFVIDTCKCISSCDLDQWLAHPKERIASGLYIYVRGYPKSY